MFAADAMLHLANAIMRCLSVHLSTYLYVAFVYCVEMSKHYCKLIAPSGRPNILVFP